nr:misshapen-like kinase 1 isoform X1 [Osmia lignaria]
MKIEYKRRTMKGSTFFLVLAAGLANAQLNFEGNPLTENTEYKAEESRSSENTARQETTANVTTVVTEHSVRNVYPLAEYVKNSSENILMDHQKLTADPEQKENSVVVQTARQLSSNTYNPGATSVNPAMALNSFLNSKTPEESRLSLNHYLQSREISQNTAVQEQTTVRTINDQQQFMPRLDQQSAIVSPVNQQLTSQLMQQRQMLQAYPVNQQQFNEQMYNTPVNLQDLRSPLSNTVATSLMQQQLLQPYVTGLQPRNDVFYPAGWPHRVRRVRGKPFPYAQSRGGPGLYGPPPPIPFKQKGPPIEVIYTKPPGFHRGPPAPLSNPPVPYEDASAWFPEAHHPPSKKDVYYSQLYAQSYDPHYYNYIAKTGKIKPHLYGKLGKYREEESDGIWAELYRGFKKHGLKNIMTPTFLLGMTLPVVTLMLTALVQKRSISRSDSRELSKEDAIQEYLEQIQRAVECYEKKRRKREANVDGC